MDRLENARKIINETDREMAKLFEKRMNAVYEVAEYKKEMGLPIFDEKRENAVIEKNSAFVENDKLRSYYISFIKSTMDISKKYQESLLDGLKVAYSGVEGAFAHIAAKNIFPDGKALSYDDFLSAYRSVENGECDCAVLPIENSFAGEVGQVTDIMFEGNLHINGVYELKIVHNLLGINGSSMGSIKKVVSHPQALSQCADYIKKNNFDTEKASNTACAAQLVSESGDISIAAIASEETARLYNLKMLDHDINSSSANSTRFAVFSRAENLNINPKDNVFILMFTVGHTTGSLAKAISVISGHGYNMRVLRSRPAKKENWQYYFYVEAEGNPNTPDGKAMIKELSECCDKIKIVGNYSQATLDGGDSK